MEDSDSGPEEVVKIHSAAPTIIIQNLLTSTISRAITSHAKFPTKKKHAKNAGKYCTFHLYTDMVLSGTLTWYNQVQRHGSTRYTNMVQPGTLTWLHQVHKHGTTTYTDIVIPGTQTW